MVGTVPFDDSQRILAKQKQDAYTVLMLGASTTVMMFLTAMLLMQFLPNLSRQIQIVLVVITLAGSSAFWFLGKKDDRWSVLCTLINHVGLGIGFFMLLKLLKLTAAPLDFAFGALPGIALLAIFCLLFGGADAMAKGKVRLIGILLFAAAFLAACLIASKLGSMIYKLSVMSILVCFASFLALIFTAMDPTRSVHRTMALLSFIVYLLVIAALVIAFIVYSKKDSDSDSNGHSSGHASNHSTGHTGYGNHFYFRRSSFLDYWLLSRLYLSPADQRGYYDPATIQRRRRTSRFLAIAMGILLIAFVAVVLAVVLA